MAEILTRLLNLEESDKTSRRFERDGEIRGYERFISSIALETQKINRHLPKSRKTLEHLLLEKDPKVESVDGGCLYFKRADLERASTEVFPEHRKSLRLPIVLIRRLELGKGVFVLLGDKAEHLFVRKVLGLVPNSSNFHDAAKDELVLYYVQVQELLNKFRSLVAIGFGVPDDYASD